MMEKESVDKTVEKTTEEKISSKKISNKIKLLILIGIVFICGIAVSIISGVFSKNELRDGEYETSAALEGGTGKATIKSPAKITVSGGEIVAEIEWSSSNYDYMIVDGVKYFPVNETGHSVFEIPVKNLDEALPIIADTTAMSTPHEIEYTITFGGIDQDKNSKLEHSFTMSGCGAKREDELVIPDKIGEGLVWESKIVPEYAKGFEIDYYTSEDGVRATLITIYDDAQYIVFSSDIDTENSTDDELGNYDKSKYKESVPKDMIMISSVENIYLVASQTMDMFAAMDSVDKIRFSGVDKDDWFIQEAIDKMEAGDMIYAGKYSAPDYELIVNNGCDLVIENTMIYHTPEVKEKLESFGIPVFVDRSSYEGHPLGRTEWVKIYGAILGKEDIAEAAFNEQVAEYEAINGKLVSLNEDATNSNNVSADGSATNNKPVVAFFYIAANGSVKVRKSSDYVPQMIEMAGGQYAFSSLGEDDENSSSTVNMQMEEFYAVAKDADYIIYNSTVAGELGSIEDLIAKNELLATTKAVKEGRVYCTSENLYQSTMEIGTIILDINKMLSGEDDMTFIFKLE